MERLSEGPWAPGQLHVDGVFVETEPLATWWVAFDQIISDWKQDRHYVDARDVSPASFPHHPAKLLGDDFPRLRALLDETPVLALGASLEGVRMPGARLYSVGFVRTADDYFAVSAKGPSLKRTLGAPFFELEKAVGANRGDDSTREVLIDRILAHITNGRLTRRSLDLAEMWSALAGGPSMFVFDGEAGRMEYLRVLEESLEEAFARLARHREEHDAIVAALREAEASGASRIELPVLGWASRQELGAVKIKGVRDRSTQGILDRIVLDCDGKTSIRLPAIHQWVLKNPVPPFEPASIRAWKAGAGERERRMEARSRAEFAARRRSLKRKLLLTLLALGVLIGGPCVYQLRKGGEDDPCTQGADCRSGHCRNDATGTGKCALLCGRRFRCNPGRVCRYDPQEKEFLCEAAEP